MPLLKICRSHADTDEVGLDFCGCGSRITTKADIMGLRQTTATSVVVIALGPNNKLAPHLAGAFFLIVGFVWSPAVVDFSNDRIASNFVLSSWHELFHAFTPDSSQPRLHNIPSLVEELAAIADRWQFDDRNKTHARKVQDELREALDEESDILARIPDYQSRAEQLIDDAASPLAIAADCKALIAQKTLYGDTSLARSRELIRGLPKRKVDAHMALRRVATIAFQSGKEDNDVWDPLSKDAASSHAEIFEEIINLATAADRTFECTLAVAEHPQVHAAIRMCGLSPVSSAGLPAEYLHRVSEKTERFIFTRTTVEATSIRHAVACSRKKLGIATGLVSLYQNVSALVHPVALVNDNGRDVVFSQSEQAFRRLYPRANPTKDIREAIKMLDKSVDVRLLGTIELLSLAAASSDARTRLVNFWSALETLAGAHEADTTLERVSSMVLPLVMSRHVGRSARYLAIATQRFGVLVGSQDFGDGFPRSNSGYVAPSEMLKTLTSPRNSSPIKQLLRFAEHPLLRYRIFRAWQTCHDPRELCKSLQRSKSRLDWHLARIYRARNLLVHQGIESPFLVPLLDNLQNYISMAVQHLIHELKAHPDWTVRDTIAFWNWRMHHQFSSLLKRPSVLSASDFIDTSDRAPLWQTQR